MKFVSVKLIKKIKLKVEEIETELELLDITNGNNKSMGWLEIEVQREET